MAETHHCWRCRKAVPLLTEEEWAFVEPHLADGVGQIKRYRNEHGGSLEEAKQFGFGRQALEEYERITGYRETSADALMHHRLSSFGPPCTSCGQLLRTPRARFCASCGSEK